MTATTTPPTRRPALDRATAMRLAETEYRRYLDQLRSLAVADWSRPTDCQGWDVRAMAAHNLGMAEFAASLREMARVNIAAMRAQRRLGGSMTDHMTALQVDERRAMGPAEIVDRYAAVLPRAVQGRRRRPALLRGVPMGQVDVPGAPPEPWVLGFVIDTILTRDCWMHRVDTARATGRDVELTGEHDGVLVADVVAEWAQRHGAPCTLTLTGPAGGRWAFGVGGPELECDAVQFCRVLSGRTPGDGLLATAVPF